MKQRKPQFTKEDDERFKISLKITKSEKDT